jgi:hypothetical protein
MHFISSSLSLSVPFHQPLFVSFAPLFLLFTLLPLSLFSGFLLVLESRNEVYRSPHDERELG